MLDEVVPCYDELYDDDGDVGLVLQDCAEGLGQCLTEGKPDAETRQGWLEVLLEAELKDIEIGGVDLAYPARGIILDHATDDEWECTETSDVYRVPKTKRSYSVLCEFKMIVV